MTRKKSRYIFNRYSLLIIFSLAVLIYLMTVNLGKLTHGLSYSEAVTAKSKLGWHGLYNNAINLPLKVVQSAVFFKLTHLNHFLLRLPSAIFGIISVCLFSALIYMWHGKRTCFFMTILFATSAFTLHVSRLATSDIIYFWGMVMLLFNHSLFYRYNTSNLVFILNFFIWGLLLTIPGFIFFVLLDLFFQRKVLTEAWFDDRSIKIRTVSVILVLLWLPLIIHNALHIVFLKIYLGFPAHFAALSTYPKNFASIFIHLFVKGPQYPSLWLGKVPLLDFFTLSIALLGVIFYITRLDSSRSRWLFSVFILSTLLVSLKGVISFSLIVPLLYVFAATGLAFLLQKWLRVFPLNPLARSLGIGLISLAVLISAIYNLRSYFVAWRYSDTTKQTFSHHL